MSSINKKTSTFFKSYGEHIVFACAVFFLMMLLVWWAIFLNRIVDENFTLKKYYIESTYQDPAKQKIELLKAQKTDHSYQRMLVGEGAVLAGLIGICIVFLFWMAREKQAAKEKMQNTLVFTTHELKTPLSGLKALLQSLEIGSIPLDQQTQLLKSGLFECQKLEHLIETILAYQRAVVSLEHLESIDVQTLIQDILAHRKKTFRHEKIDFQPVLQPYIIKADANALRVVLENLLDNAYKYGGSENTPVVLSQFQVDKYWQLQVKDFGKGLSAKDCERIFQPFSQNSKKHSSIQHGNGLGLFISRYLIEQMNGRLTAQSLGEGKGTTFTLLLMAC